MLHLLPAHGIRWWVVLDINNDMEGPIILPWTCFSWDKTGKVPSFVILKYHRSVLDFSLGPRVARYRSSSVASSNGACYPNWRISCSAKSSITWIFRGIESDAKYWVTDPRKIGFFFERRSTVRLKKHDPTRSSLKLSTSRSATVFSVLSPYDVAFQPPLL